MSKVKLLLDVVEDMRSLADSLQAVADAICQNDSSPALSENVTEMPVEATPSAPEPPRVFSKTDPEYLALRALMGEKSRNGKGDTLRAFLQEYGVDRLSALDPRHYKAMREKVEVL